MHTPFNLEELRFYWKIGRWRESLEIHANARPQISETPEQIYKSKIPTEMGN